jgi:hypothetical protein
LLETSVTVVAELLVVVVLVGLLPPEHGPTPEQILQPEVLAVTVLLLLLLVRLLLALVVAVVVLTLEMETVELVELVELAGVVAVVMVAPPALREPQTREAEAVEVLILPDLALPAVRAWSLLSIQQPQWLPPV